MSDKSKIETELDFLTALEEGTVVTQMTLAKRVAVSVGLINALLKRAVGKGFVKAKSAPYKRYAYYMTPTGFAEKGRLVREYLEASLKFFRSARLEYYTLAMRARGAGKNRLVFVGAGELAEIALLAAREAEVDIVAVIDTTTNRAKFCGLPVVRDPADLKNGALNGALNGIDGVIITDRTRPQEAFEMMRTHYADTEIFTPPLLRISRRPVEFSPKVAGS